MKKLFTLFGIIVLATIIGITMVSCGGSDPKELAKQSYDLSIEAMNALFSPSKAADIAKKTASLEAKIAKLSASDKAIYDQELTRLIGGSFGNFLNFGSDLLNSGTDALSSAQQTLDSLNLQDALNASQQALDALNSLSVDDSLNAAQKALDALGSLDANESLNAAQKALNALSPFGF